jgi:hypothetical protein
VRLAPEARLSDEAFKFSLAFRELTYYFIRVGKDAFVDPQSAFSGQRGPSNRVAVEVDVKLDEFEVCFLRGDRAEFGELAPRAWRVVEQMRCHSLLVGQFALPRWIVDVAAQPLDNQCPRIRSLYALR